MILYGFICFFILFTVIVWAVLLRRRLNFPKPDIDPEVFRGIVGHRGCRVDDIPENSMFSFTYALDAGLEGIELDVRLTKDKKAVVCHDDTIRRVLDGEGRVSQLTWDELQTIPFNKNTKHLRLPDDWKEYVESRLPGESVDRVPSLEQVILFAKRYKIKLVIDLKESKDRLRLYQEIISLFQKYDLYSSAFIAAFNPWDLYFFKKCGGINIVSCFLYSRTTLEWYHKEGLKEIRLPFFMDFRFTRWIGDQLIVYFAVHIAEAFGAQIIGPDWDLVSRELISTAKRRGMNIYSWTVNGEVEKEYFNTFPIMFATDNHPQLQEPSTPTTPLVQTLPSDHTSRTGRSHRYETDSDVHSQNDQRAFSSFRSSGTVVRW